MASAVSKMVSGWLTRLTPGPEAELLHRYVTTGDQQAFAALVERFAPLVWGVCSRSLRSPQDAEDAFQATFLALSKQAGQLTDRGPLGAWLHLVARRSAALVHRNNRRRKEVPVDALPDPSAAPAPDDRELAAALDQEIDRLPEKYRRPVVLCHLQNQTYAEAARALGCSVPTVCRRVTRGCELLRGRLTNRGVAPTGGLAVVFAAVAQPASAMPVGLIARTVQAVGAGTAGASAAIADAVLGSMGWAKTFKIAGLISAVALTGAGGVGLAVRGTSSPVEADRPAAVAVALRPAPLPAGPKLDRLGDPLPAGAVTRIGTVRMRAEPGPGDVAFLPGGKTVASVHGRSAVVVWDIESGKEVRRVSAPEQSFALAPSADGNRLAVVGTAEVRILDVSDPSRVKTLWKWSPAVMTGPAAIAAAFTADGRTLAVNDPKAGVIRLLDADTGNELRTLPGSVLHGLAFSPDGKTLAGLRMGPRSGPTGYAAYQIALWDVAAGTPKPVPNVVAGRVYGFAFAGGSLIVGRVGPDLMTVAVDLATGRETARWLTRTVHPVHSAAPDGVLELAGGKVTIRDPLSGKVVRTTAVVPELAIVDRKPDVTNWRFSPDGKLFAAAAGGGQVWVWDVAAGREAGPPGRIHGPVQALAFSPDGSALTTLHGSAGRSWDVGSGTPGLPLAGSNDGELAARDLVYADPAGPTAIQLPTPADRGLRATSWDAATGAAANRSPIPADVWQTGAASGAVSPDGRYLAWGTPAVVTLIDRATGQEVRRLTPATSGPAGLRFSADGRTLLRLPERADVAEAWDVEAGTLRATVPLPPRDIYGPPAVALMTDGRWLAAAGKMPRAPTDLVVTEIESGESLRLAESDQPLYALAFSPDGRRLAAGAEDGSVRVWDLATKKEFPPLRGHRGRVLAVIFSPDGTKLASGGLDGTGLVWDAPQASDRAGKPAD
jgi:RNA polymerase sigma factor (sigma-70 family)